MITPKPFLFAAIFCAFIFGAGALEPLKHQKAIILTLNYSGGELSLIDQQIVYGNSPDYRASPQRKELFFKFYASDGAIFQTHPFDDPRYLLNETFFPNGTIEGQWVFLPERVFTVVFSFSHLTSKIKAFNRTQSELLSFDLNESLFFFCNSPDSVCDMDCNYDVDCATKPSTNASVPAPAPSSFLPTKNPSNTVSATKVGDGAMPSANGQLFPAIALACFAIVALVIMSSFFRKKRG